MTVIVVAVTVVTIVLIIIFITWRCQTKLTQKHHDEDKEKLCSTENEQDGLIEVDEDMFATHGPDRFVPTMVKEYEGMATDEQADKAQDLEGPQKNKTQDLEGPQKNKTQDLEEPQKNANVKSTTVASLMEKFQNPQVI